MRPHYAFILAAVLATLPAGPLSAQTPAEKVLSSLAGLSPEQRRQRLEEGARKEGALVMDPNMRGQLLRDHTALFQKRYPFLKLDYSDLSDEQAADRFVIEQTAGRHMSDLIGVTVPDLANILKRDLVAANPTPAVERLLPNYRGFIDPQHRWVPWYWSEHGISYNSRLISRDKAPKSWEDLCNPAYRGQVSYEPFEFKFLAGPYLMMGEEKFRDWTKCIGANKPILQEGHITRMELMLAGDHAIQGENFFYDGMTRLLANKNLPYEIVWTAPIMARAGVVAIAKTARHPHAAALYADWLLSEESQKFVHDGQRGPLTMKHPFIPDSAPLFTYGEIPEGAYDKIADYWRANVAQAK